MSVKRELTVAVRWISTFGYLMSSLKMASGVHREESVFTSSLRPYRFSPLHLSHETERDGKEIPMEHVGRKKMASFALAMLTVR